MVGDDVCDTLLDNSATIQRASSRVSAVQGDLAGFSLVSKSSHGSRAMSLLLTTHLSFNSSVMNGGPKSHTATRGRSSGMTLSINSIYKESERYPERVLQFPFLHHNYLLSLTKYIMIESQSSVPSSTAS
jgi:hypothetical protein